MNVHVSFVAVVCLVSAFWGCGGSSPPHHAEASETAKACDISFEALGTRLCKILEQCRSLAESECRTVYKQNTATLSDVCKEELDRVWDCAQRSGIRCPEVVTPDSCKDDPYTDGHFRTDGEDREIEPPEPPVE